MVPQDFLREVGAFQMLRPWDVDAIDMLVYCLQTMNFLSLPLKHLSSFYQKRSFPSRWAKGVFGLNL